MTISAEPVPRMDQEAELSALLERAANCDGKVCVALSAPVLPLEAALAADLVGERTFWAPTRGMGCVGFGIAERLTARGVDRFAELREQSVALLAKLTLIQTVEARQLRPRLFGGGAFTPGASDHSPWQAFGDAELVLPEFSYFREQHGAWVSGVFEAERLRRPGGISFAQKRVTAFIRALRQSAAHVPESPPRARRALNEPPASDYARLVEAVKARIARGQFEKVVVARSLLLELDPAPKPEEVLTRLRESENDCTRFVFEHAGQYFVGATPEHLVHKQGLELHTEAIAGSAKAGAEASALLLASGKNRREHRLVVDELVRRLQPLCSELHYSNTPDARPLRHVVHLHTPIRARLREPVHVLDLVGSLHPTPAVGGLPNRAALEWIAQHEPTPRGWYAGPVGWVDAAGDGEFVVALRSALVAGRTARLYAGAGIVSDSDADAEYQETELKLTGMLSALGART